jgi:hypothetical protein
VSLEAMTLFFDTVDFFSLCGLSLGGQYCHPIKEKNNQMRLFLIKEYFRESQVISMSSHA